MVNSNINSPPPASAPPPLDVVAYVNQTLNLLRISVAPEHHGSVVENFSQVHAIAQAVLDFPLPDTLEAMPRFEP